MRYATIYPFDISNGQGIRVSLFTQGCDKHCPGCFNSETWDFNSGKEFSYETISEILRLAKPDWISGLSILGGEPLNPKNISEVAHICTAFKNKYPNKTIWIWTGYTFEELKHMQNPYISIILQNADYIIDGPFIESEKDLSLKWRGSANQHIWRKGGNKMSDRVDTWYCEE